MKTGKVSVVVCLILLLSLATGSSRVFAFQDPLDTPARMVGDLERRPMQAVARVGKRLLAVGSRGVIIHSDDGGNTWVQSTSPVQSDLLAVHFPTDKTGWIVGHDGVILHSVDAGSTWSKQFDGRKALPIFTDYYQKQLASGNDDAEKALELVELNYGSGPSLPFLDVWFEDQRHGFAIGSFGLLAATSDGGITWEPWFNRIDNQDQLSLNAIEDIGGDIYIAAERGVIFRLDRETGRFVAQQTGAEGSLFGLAGVNEMIVAFGLGGSVYKSIDQGDSWHASLPLSNASITSGIIMRDPSQFLLANTAGELLQGYVSSVDLALSSMEDPVRITGVVLLPDGDLLISSLEGVKIMPLSAGLIQP